jgi:thiamine-phosphate pyrophosphorylase
MNARKQAAPDAPDTRLYLATPVLAETADFARGLPELLGGVDIAAVLVRLAPAAERTLINHLKALAPIIQNAGIAMLIDGHAELVARSGADGAHLSGTDALGEALPMLKPDGICGAGGLHSRHDAMSAGEAGVDYVLFGEPDMDGVAPSLEAVVERVSWWAEVFTPPCVAYAAELSSIDALAQARADFILLDDAIWHDPRGARAALTEASDLIEAHNERAATQHETAGR